MAGTLHFGLTAVRLQPQRRTGTELQSGSHANCGYRAVVICGAAITNGPWRIFAPCGVLTSVPVRGPQTRLNR